MASPVRLLAAILGQACLTTINGGKAIRALALARAGASALALGQRRALAIVDVTRVNLFTLEASAVVAFIAAALPAAGTPISARSIDVAAGSILLVAPAYGHARFFAS